MDFDGSRLRFGIEIVFLGWRSVLFLWLWNGFVPLWRRKNEDTVEGFEKREVIAVSLLLCAIGAIAAAVSVNFPIFMALIAGISMGFIALRHRQWWLETAFVLTLFWSTSSLTYFMVNSLTNRFFSWLIEGIEQADNIERFVEGRIVVMQITLYICYVVCWTMAIMVIKKVVRSREKIRLPEFGFLTIQNLAGIILTMIMTRLAVISLDDGAFILTEEKPELLWQMPIVAALLYFGELAAIYLWQQNNHYRRRSERYQMERLEKEAMRRRLDDLTVYHEKVRKVRHDMASHLTNIKGLSEHGYGKELEAYIENLDEEIRSITTTVSTGHPVTDMVIGDRYHKAKEAGVTLDCRMYFDEDWGVAVYDLGIVIANVLDNAIRAAAVVMETDKFVSFRIEERPAIILVICENAYDPDAKTERKNSEWHGLGLKNVADIAERYDGKTQIRRDEHTFHTTVMLKRK